MWFRATGQIILSPSDFLKQRSPKVTWMSSFKMLPKTHVPFIFSLPACRYFCSWYPDNCYTFKLYKLTQWHEEAWKEGAYIPLNFFSVWLHSSSLWHTGFLWLQGAGLVDGPELLLLGYEGFSWCRAGVLECVGSGVAMWDFSSLTRDQTPIPWIERQILNPWTHQGSSLHPFYKTRKTFPVGTVVADFLSLADFTSHHIGWSTKLKTKGMGLLWLDYLIHILSPPMARQGPVFPWKVWAPIPEPNQEARQSTASWRVPAEG